MTDFKNLTGREVREGFQTSLAAFGTNYAIALWIAEGDSDKDTV